MRFVRCLREISVSILDWTPLEGNWGNEMCALDLTILPILGV
jgi:hypothetical protein